MFLTIFFLPLIIANLILSPLAASILQLGYINLLAAVARGGPFSYHLILKNLNGKKAAKFLVATLLYGILVGVGLILLVIPGIYFATKYLFFAFITAEEDPGILASLRRSAELTKGVKLKLFFFILACLLLQIAGVLVFGIGLLATVNIGSLAVAYIYTQLNPQTSDLATHPTTQPPPSPTSPPPTSPPPAQESSQNQPPL